MTAMFDTLKFARALRDGGQFTPEQSERLSDALSDAITGEVVSRADLAATEAKLGRKMDDLRAELVAVETRLDRKIDGLRADLDHNVKALRADIDHNVKELRADIDHNVKELRADIDHNVKELRAELKGVGFSLEAKFEAAKADTLKWIVGIIGFQSVAIIGAAIVLARILAH